jgi:hypothetical protein
VPDTPPSSTVPTALSSLWFFARARRKGRCVACLPADSPLCDTCNDAHESDLISLYGLCYFMIGPRVYPGPTISHPEADRMREFLRPRSLPACFCYSCGWLHALSSGSRLHGTLPTKIMLSHSGVWAPRLLSASFSVTRLQTGTWHNSGFSRLSVPAPCAPNLYPISH